MHVTETHGGCPKDQQEMRCWWDGKVGRGHICGEFTILNLRHCGKSIKLHVALEHSSSLESNRKRPLVSKYFLGFFCWQLLYFIQSELPSIIRESLFYFHWERKKKHFRLNCDTIMTSHWDFLFYAFCKRFFNTLINWSHQPLITLKYLFIHSRGEAICPALSGGVWYVLGSPNISNLCLSQ